VCKIQKFIKFKNQLIKNLNNEFYTRTNLRNFFGNCKRENGYQELLKLSLESIMKSERDEFNKLHNDVSNGYRFRSVLGHGGKLELVIPRSRHNNFYPLILALIKDQEQESKTLAYELYSSGLTTEQIGTMFEKVYGHHYSKSSISNMMQTAREDVQAWLHRPLSNTYPIIYIDATYWHTRRLDSVSSEAIIQF